MSYRFGTAMMSTLPVAYAWRYQTSTGSSPANVDRDDPHLILRLVRQLSDRHTRCVPRFVAQLGDEGPGDRARQGARLFAFDSRNELADFPERHYRTRNPAF